MTQLRVMAQALRPGDVTTGTGETVTYVGAGVRTPSGKVDVLLKKAGMTRSACWRKQTIITINRGGEDGNES